MPFNIRSLALHNSTPFGTAGKAVNWYNYASADAVATVIAAGYFNAARDPKLKVNDVVECMCLADGVGDRVSVIVTASPAAGDVTVAVNTDASGL